MTGRRDGSGKWAASTRRSRRYAHGNQPRIARWNLARFAQALLPLLGDDGDGAVAAAQDAIDTFPARFQAAYHAALRRKLGLAKEREGDRELAQDLLNVMAENKGDFTLTFRRLSDATCQCQAVQIGSESVFAPHNRLSMGAPLCCFIAPMLLVGAGAIPQGEAVSTMAEWLAALGMAEYTERFAKNRIDSRSSKR